MPFKLLLRNDSAAIRGRRIRFTAALILTVGVGISADAYKQAQLRRNMAPGVKNMPSALLPQPAVSASVYSRVVWIDNDTFLHLQSIQGSDTTPGAKSQISLTRYRYVPAGGNAILRKEHEYSWPFDATLTFAYELPGEICLSPDKQNLLVPLSTIKARPWDGPRYVGRVALSAKNKTSSSALWELKMPPKRCLPYRFFWLPDSRHFIVVLEYEAIDLFDIYQNAPGVRIAADSITTGNDSTSIAKVALWDKEVVGFTPDSELVLRQIPTFVSGSHSEITSLVLEKVPVSAKGIQPGRQQKIEVNTTAIEIQDALLSSDGKRLLFRSFFPAPRIDKCWQSFVRPIFMYQYATLDLQTGTTTPLFAQGLEVQVGPNHDLLFMGNIERRYVPNNMNFSLQWLPGSDFVSVCADSPSIVNNYAVWRVPVVP